MKREKTRTYFVEFFSRSAFSLGLKTLGGKKSRVCIKSPLTPFLLSIPTFFHLSHALLFFGWIDSISETCFSLPFHANLSHLSFWVKVKSPEPFNAPYIFGRSGKVLTFSCRIRHLSHLQPSSIELAAEKMLVLHQLSHLSFSPLPLF